MADVPIVTYYIDKHSAVWAMIRKSHLTVRFYTKK